MSKPSGASTASDQRAVGDDVDSAKPDVGGSTDQPTPGSHASRGRKEPSRNEPACREIRSFTGPPTVSRHGTRSAIASPGAAQRPSPTTAVVGSEIGRASWRERGCRYGECPVGAVSLKKKKKNN